jgi:5'-3' exonuclease
MLFDGMPDDLRSQLAAWVEARREKRLRAEVEECEARMPSRLPAEAVER